MVGSRVYPQEYKYGAKHWLGLIRGSNTEASRIIFIPGSAATASPELQNGVWLEGTAAAFFCEPLRRVPG